MMLDQPHRGCHYRCCYSCCNNNYLAAACALRMHVWLTDQYHMAMSFLQGMVTKRMSAHVLRGGGVCSARTRQVARNSLVVSMVHALPTAAVTAAFVKMDGVAQIVRLPVP